MTTRNATLPACGAILAAGGIGTRMGAGRPKQLLPLAGRPVLTRSCRALLAVAAIREIVVVAPPDFLEECRSVLRDDLADADYARLRFTEGGATRQDSVRNGLARLAPDLLFMLVHDAARPLVAPEMIANCLAVAAKHGAAIAALPLADTLKRVGEDGLIRATIDRTGLWRAQTPQVIRRDLLLAAYEKAEREGLQTTDEAGLLENAGIPVAVAAGMAENIKITRPEDLRLAESFLDEKNAKKMRIGHGFDAHRLVPGRRLVLGGVVMEHHLGLLGHSDADVACHALTDAILGALGLGDIGRHFPDSDAAYKDADSLRLLERVWALAAERGMRLANADLTIICQRPKLAPHLERMRANLARACGAEPERVNVKATTTEHMGYTGREEGIAAHAVVLLEHV